MRAAPAGPRPQRRDRTAPSAAAARDGRGRRGRGRLRAVVLALGLVALASLAASAGASADRDAASGAAARAGEPAPSADAAPSGVESRLSRHLAEARPLLERWGYAAVFAAIFVEGFGVPAPGQTLLVAAAIFAAQGELALVPLLAVAFAGSAGGTLVGWWLGRVGGRRLLDRFAGPRLDRLQDACRRRGGALVGFGRFVDGARQLAGIVAGALGMPFATVLLWDLVGAVAWVAVWGAGSFVLERDVHVLVEAYHRVGPVAASVILASAAAVVLWMVRGRRRR